MSSFRFTKLKIVVSYTLLMIVLLSGLFFIRREMRNLSASDSHEELMTDSLLMLLNRKDQSILQLIQLMNKENSQTLSTADFERLVAEQDSVFTQQRVQRNVVAKYDTIIQQPTKKKFFKRVAEVFAPSKQADTAVHYNTTYEVTVDTLLETINPADSIHQRLRQANQANLKKRKATIRRNSAYFKKLNIDLTAQMDTIMKGFENNLINQAKAMSHREQMVRQRSSSILGYVALGAILLIILFMIIIWRDLARNNRYRKELEDANKRAGELLETREKLMLTITHDIKAPLSSIIGYIDLMNQLSINDKEKEYLSNMESSSKHILKLVTDLLDFHRLDLNKMEINRESFNPYLLFDELGNSFSPLVHSKHLSFNVSLSSDLDGYFISDSLRIRQIVTNLLSNAIKFTNKGEISLTAQYNSSMLVISVKDTGIGMKSNQKKIAFQEFTRLPQAQGQDGVGLGLSIVSKLVALLEGTINVKSEINEGTEFVVKIPIYRLQGEPEHKQTTPLHSLSILIIDDDKVQLALTREMLLKQGIQSTCCTQVDEVLDELRANRFDALLTDVQMPTISGFDLLNLLRSANIGQSKDIPIIAVTARSDIQKNEFVDNGFYGCLYKPFTSNELLSILHQIDNNQTHSQELASLPSINSVADDEFDFTALIAFTIDDKEVSKSILSTFVDETMKDIDTIREALTDNNICIISSKAHKLLPLFILMNNSESIELLKLMEKEANGSFTEELKQKTLRLMILLEASVLKAKNYLNTL